MKFLPANTLIVALLAPVAATTQENLRSRKLQAPESCTVLVRDDLPLNPNDIGYAYECEFDAEDTNNMSGLSLPINATEAQNQMFKKLLKDGGGYTSGESKLKLDGASISNEEVTLPPELEIVLEKIPQNNRKLAIVTGNIPILVVKVTDAVGLARSETPAQIGDDVFGTNGDPVNLKSQLFDCSAGKLNVLEGDPSLPNGVPAGKGFAPGVMEVTISVTLEGNSRATIRNAVTTAVQNAIGETLPGRYEHVMYVLESCKLDCGWAAYAYVNSWNSVYQGVYYKFAAIQIHELGHNFNLAHSGGLNGNPYQDHTGLMGNPLYSDDIGKMCFNAAKNWQIGWYNDRKMLINPIDEPSKTVALVGIADYLNNPNGHPVVVKVETGLANDFFVGFNRAIGANAQDVEGRNVVTVEQVDGNNGEGYSQSFLKAKLAFGGDATGTSYSIENFGGTGYPLTISVQSIDLNSSPGTAVVAFQYESGSISPTNSQSAPPTVSPTISSSRCPS